MTTSSLRVRLTAAPFSRHRDGARRRSETRLAFVRPAATQQVHRVLRPATKTAPGRPGHACSTSRSGKVLSVTPRTTACGYGIEVDGTRRSLRDARATIVAPTMVSVRHIELSPVYDGGRALGDGARSRCPAPPYPWSGTRCRASSPGWPRPSDPRAPTRRAPSATCSADAAANLDGQGEQLGADAGHLIAEALQTLSDNRGRPVRDRAQPRRLRRSARRPPTGRSGSSTNASGPGLASAR